MPTPFTELHSSTGRNRSHRVGVKEFEAVAALGKFLPGGTSLEGRQFAMTMQDALAYANTSKGPILKATIEEVLSGNWISLRR